MDRIFEGLEAFGRFVERQAAIAEAAPAIAAEYAQHVLHENIIAVIGDAAKIRDLMPSTQAERVREGYTANDPLLRSGDYRDTIEHAALGPVAAVGTSDPRGVWFEFGTLNMAPLPHFETGLRDSEPEIAAIVDDVIGVTLGLGVFGARVITE